MLFLKYFQNIFQGVFLLEFNSSNLDAEEIDMMKTLFMERHHDLGKSLVLGVQWGDEGKGKMVDWLVQHSDVVVRFNGGHNAGHTVKANGQEFDLHMLPSGMVSPGKINVIASSCVLSINLNKVDLKQFTVDEHTQEAYCKSTIDEILKKDDKTGEIIRVGMIPELEQLESKGVDLSRKENNNESKLKVSADTPVIGMHHLLSDALRESQLKAITGARAVGSTGSGISPAYSADTMRDHFSLSTLLRNPDAYYTSIKVFWKNHQVFFPNISEDDLINDAKNQRDILIKYISQGKIEIIDDEVGYFSELDEQKKKIVGEGAQSTLISSENSYFGTASTPRLKTFLETTKYTAEQIANIFLTHKDPSSSVGERPDYLKMPYHEDIKWFWDKYDEYGVTSKRRRDLFYRSIVELAHGNFLAYDGIDDKSKLVAVINRIDAMADTIKIHPDEILKIVTSYRYHRAQYDITPQYKTTEGGVILPDETIHVGLQQGDLITPQSARKNYPSKSDQLFQFGMQRGRDVDFVEITGKDVAEKAKKIIGTTLASIYDDDDDEREVVTGWGPDRKDQKVHLISPMRSL